LAAGAIAFPFDSIKQMEQKTCIVELALPNGLMLAAPEFISVRREALLVVNRQDNVLSVLFHASARVGTA
jgi:hypothetical protein